MAHGDTNDQNEEFIKGVDGETILLNEEILCKLTKKTCPGLEDKAALVFIQACRGENGNTANAEADASMTKRQIPSVADMLVWKAAVENSPAVRFPKKGTWFVNAVSKKILRDPKVRLSKIIHEVTFEASQDKYTLERIGDTFPMPCISHSTLRADFYFK